MAEPKKYEISTIKDIFDKVPSEKVKQCLDELGVAIVQAQTVRNITGIVAEQLGEQVEGVVEWPETSTWIDDDQGEITLNFAGEGGGMSLKTWMEKPK